MIGINNIYNRVGLPQIINSTPKTETGLGGNHVIVIRGEIDSDKESYRLEV